jgi:hypothetical protein
MIGSASVFAGASSENRLDEKALQGPGGEGAHSTDPGIERSGSPGPAGPSDAQKQPSYQFNPDAGSSATGSSGSTGATGSGAGTSDADTDMNSGSGAGSGSSSTGSSGSGALQKQPHDRKPDMQ